MADGVQVSALEPIPQLYALHRDDDDEGGAATVVAWGLAFADGSAVTVWSNPDYGAAVAVSGSVQAVEQTHAHFADAE
ncbi:MAG: hypothetical protein ACRDT0_00870, partial [Pseudonocardiaceae bacterium]